MNVVYKILLWLLSIVFVVISFILIVLISLPTPDKKEIDFNRQLPKYFDKVEYIEGGFGDFTEYKEYYYSKDKISEFKNNNYFKQVDEGDAETLSGYFKHFEALLQFFDYKDEYRFDKSQIKANDYFYIESKGASPYDNYDVYYVDVEKCIMYFIHSNI